MKVSPYWLLMFVLMGCAQADGLLPPQTNLPLAPMVASAIAKDPANQPGTGILPGPKGNVPVVSEILPGSKGDLQLKARLEVQVRVPAADAFAVQQLSDEGPAGWSAEVNGVKAGRTRLLGTQRLGEELLLSFGLEEIPLLPDAPYQDLSFYSAAGILQSAGLIPAQDFSQQRLPSPLTGQTLAIWMIARNYAQQQHVAPQGLGPEVLAQLNGLPEVAQLEQALQAFYLEHKGKTDPRKAAEIASEASTGAQELEEKVKQAERKPKPSASNSASPNPAVTPVPAHSVEPGPKKSPGPPSD